MKVRRLTAYRKAFPRAVPVRAYWRGLVPVLGTRSGRREGRPTRSRTAEIKEPLRGFSFLLPYCLKGARKSMGIVTEHS